MALAMAEAQAVRPYNTNRNSCPEDVKTAREFGRSGIRLRNFVQHLVMVTMSLNRINVVPTWTLNACDSKISLVLVRYNLPPTVSICRCKLAGPCLSRTSFESRAVFTGIRKIVPSTRLAGPA